MKTFLGMLAVALVLVCATPDAGATAMSDVSIDKERDEKRNTVYKLVNRGTRPILVKVEHRKECPDLSSEKKPQARQYLVEPGSSIQLRKVWSESSCEHDYSVREAAYYVAKRPTG